MTSAPLLTETVVTQPQAGYAVPDPGAEPGYVARHAAAGIAHASAYEPRHARPTELTPAAPPVRASADGPAVAGQARGGSPRRLRLIPGRRRDADRHARAAQAPSPTSLPEPARSQSELVTQLQAAQHRIAVLESALRSVYSLAEDLLRTLSDGSPRAAA